MLFFCQHKLSWLILDCLSLNTTICLGDCPRFLKFHGLKFTSVYQDKWRQGRNRWTLLSLLLLFIKWFSLYLTPSKDCYIFMSPYAHMTMCAVTWCLQRLRAAVYASQESGASICCYTSLKASGICSNLATTTLARSNTDVVNHQFSISFWRESDGVRPLWRPGTFLQHKR